jgi:hypothetical protein
VALLLFIPNLASVHKSIDLPIVINYWVLNKIIVKASFILSLFEELIQKLHGKKYVSKLDVYTGYQQERLAAKDIEKTSFYNLRNCANGLLFSKVSL